jgi:hypothetical protein
LPTAVGSPRQIAWFTFALALAVRIWFVLDRKDPRDSIFSDMLEYHRLALGETVGAYREWNTVYPIGYPWIIRAIRFVSNRSEVLVGPVQALMGATSAMWVARLTARHTRNGLGSLLAGVAMACHPASVFLTGYMLTETSGAFFLTAALVALFDTDALSWRRAAIAGACLGYAASIRSNLLAVVPVLLLAAWLTRWRSPAPTPKQLGVLALSTVLAVLPSVARSSMLTGRLTGPSTNGGAVFLAANVDVKGVTYIRNYEHDGTTEPVHYRIASQWTIIRDKGEELIVDTPIHEERYFYRRALGWIVAHPREWLASLLPRGSVALALSPKTRVWPVTSDFARLIIASSRVVTLAVLFPGLVLAAVEIVRRRASFAVLTFAGTVAVGIATATIFVSDQRMFVPFAPVTFCLGTMAWCQVGRTIRERFVTRPATPGQRACC